MTHTVHDYRTVSLCTRDARSARGSGTIKLVSIGSDVPCESLILITARRTIRGTNASCRVRYLTNNKQKFIYVHARPRTVAHAALGRTKTTLTTAKTIWKPQKLQVKP